MLNFHAVERAAVATTPFEFLTAGDLLNDDDLAAVQSDFPRIDKPGVFPLGSLEYGQAFAALIEDIRSRRMMDLLGRKFGIELAGLPTMITVRGHAQGKDGRIHTDTKDKVVTGLLYLNSKWEASGGRLRMLRTRRDLENFAAEVSPSGGTLAAFKVASNSWHGHKPFVGQRRNVMFNWLRSEAAPSRQVGRHKLAAKVKTLIPIFYRGG